MALASSRVRFTVQWLPAILGFPATFFGLSNLLGFVTAVLLAVIVTQFLWIISNQVVRSKSSAQPQSTELLSNPPGGEVVACSNCGSPVTFYRPDAYHTIIMAHPCDRGDSLEAKRFCPACKVQNTKYWDIRHLGIATIPKL